MFERFRPSTRYLLGLGLALALLATTASADTPAPDFDLVIVAGRVIDPESGLDAVRNVGVRDGKIAAISDEPLKGRRTINANGLIVSPGFIDLHSHGQQLPGARMQAFDGVTTALELELGLLPIDQYYAETAKEGRPINYGASASWTAARQAVLDGLTPVPSIASFQKAAHYTNWSTNLATDEQVVKITALLEEGLRQGAIGIGLDLGYAPSSGRKELYEMNRLAAAYHVPTFIHARYASVEEPLSSFEAYEEIVAVAAATGAHMHIAHLNSMVLRDAPRVIAMLRAAQDRGIPISVEAYPYAAASTVIGAAAFRGPRWQERLGGVRYDDYEYEGRRLDEASFKKLQATDPGAIIVYRFLRPESSPGDQALLNQSILYPGGAIASDTMPWTVDGKILTGDVWPLPVNAFSHPRSAATFSRFLHLYVRERPMLSLIDALRKITLIPARILEPSVPQMRSKGRISIGADADLAIFDIDRLTDRATFVKPAVTSAGMQWLIVNGVVVIDHGRLVRSALPGRPIRRAPSQRSDGPDRAPPSQEHRANNLQRSPQR